MALKNKSKLIPLLFPLALFLFLLSCSNKYYPSASERKFEENIKAYASQKDILFLEYTNKPFDTIVLQHENFTSDIIPIIAPGINTINFMRIYKLEDDYPRTVALGSCGTFEFLNLAIRKEKGDFVIQNWGCHYGRRIYLKIE